MHFTGFNNHERDTRYATMFDYIKAKIFGHFYILGIFDDDTKFTDLRERIGWNPSQN
jgi:hypothetical protein